MRVGVGWARVLPYIAITAFTFPVVVYALVLEQGFVAALMLLLATWCLAMQYRKERRLS